MKRNKLKICRIWNWLLVLLLFLSSCSTYKHGFISVKKKNTGQLQVSDTDSLVSKKRDLVLKAENLVSKMEQRQKHDLPITPMQLNLLFENLNENFSVDSLFHIKYNYSDSSEEREYWRKQLVESAADYNRIFQQNKRIRRIINHGDRSFGVKRNLLMRSQRFAIHNSNDFKQFGVPVNTKKIKKQSSADSGYLLAHSTIGGISMLVGVLISNIHLAPEPKKNIPRLMPHLKPYDIILQKSRGRLTDKFIPGYFGHAAIYMGDSIFAEALHEGVVFSDPMKFAEGDSYLVIRVKNLSSEQKERVNDMVNIQLGKEYDYQYDAELTYQITCSELVYTAFDFISWHTHELMGRHTFSPDDIPITVLNSDLLEFVVYFDKKQTVVEPTKEFINSLLEE